jgi:hypothetical protein
MMTAGQVKPGGFHLKIQTGIKFKPESHADQLGPRFSKFLVSPSLQSTLKHSDCVAGSAASWTFIFWPKRAAPSEWFRRRRASGSIPESVRNREAAERQAASLSGKQGTKAAQDESTS